MILRQGSKGQAVAQLQEDLTALGYKTSVDGVFGPHTAFAVRRFQGANGLTIDGIAGPETLGALRLQGEVFERPDQGQRRCVFLDAGHGGLRKNLEYTTRGKFWKFPALNGKLHVGAYYYEGVRNRLVVEEVASRLGKLGIAYVRTHEAIEDISLARRRGIANQYITAGWTGPFISFHTNAASSNYSQKKLDGIRGSCVFTLPGQDGSDPLATLHFNNLSAAFPNMYMRSQSWLDGDPDHEKKLGVLRVNTDAILVEFNFHTSTPDVIQIMNPESIAKEADATVKTIQEYFYARLDKKA